MNNIYVFLIRNDVWIYILCGLGFIWYFSNLLRARAILRQAMFGLEKEKGQRLQSAAVTFMVIFAVVSGLVAYVNVEIAPTVPVELLKPPTPTPNVFATPLVSPTPLGSPQPAPPTATPPIVPTVTLRPGQETGAPANNDPLTAATPAPSPVDTTGNNNGANGQPDAPPPPAAVGCTPGITISNPGNGAVVSGAVPFFGSATAVAFGFYKLEASGPETGGIWASVIGGTIDRPVENGLLGTANMGAWSPGAYNFRLTVVDETSNEAGSCLIQLVLAE